MRLIHTTSFELEEFLEEQIPPYVILSHRWESEEVTFQKLRDGRGTQMKSWSKVRGCCAKAAANGFDYAWIDSCCIDKTSSAELSEAINSMFRWYKNATVCYAFLSDVSSGLDPTPLGSHFRSSKWFTRGWTLQELIAPTNLVFFDLFWDEIGTKSSLAELLTAITGIKTKHLFDIGGASVAQKMSWAAMRETTKSEDQAYCLMGLFDVNMPPLYGEGERAFSRLQLEILGTSDDASIFAWTDHHTGQSPSLLAKSPRAFLDSGDVVPMVSRHFNSVYSMTNRGLRLETPFSLVVKPRLKPETPILSVSKDYPWIIVPLACSLNGQRLAVMLELIDGSVDQFNRRPGQTVISMTELYRDIEIEVEEGLKSRTIYVIGLGESPVRFSPQKVFINVQNLADNGYHLFHFYVSESGDVKYSEPLRTNSLLTNPHVEFTEAEIVWTPRDYHEMSSLLLIFKNRSSRLSLQVFRYEKRADLKIVFFDHHPRQTDESMFFKHARPWKNYGDRVSESLSHGRIIWASVNIVNRSVYDTEGEAAWKVPSQMVEIGLVGDMLDCPSNRGQDSNSPSSSSPSGRSLSPVRTMGPSRRERRNERNRSGQADTLFDTGRIYDVTSQDERR